MVQIQKIIKKTRRFIIHNVFHIDDTPHRLALGIAVGFFLAWLPLIGFQMALILLIAPMFGANARVGLPLVWISNPFTAPFIYYPNYILGKGFLAFFGYDSGSEISFRRLARLLILPEGEGGLFVQMFGLDYWRNIVSFLTQVGVELWVGSIIAGLVMGVIFYFVTYKAIVFYRNHTPDWSKVTKVLHLKKKEQHIEEESQD